MSFQLLNEILFLLELHVLLESLDRVKAALVSINRRHQILRMLPSGHDSGQVSSGVDVQQGAFAPEHDSMTADLVKLAHRAVVIVIVM